MIIRVFVYAYVSSCSALWIPCRITSAMSAADLAQALLPQ